MRLIDRCYTCCYLHKYRDLEGKPRNSCQNRQRSQAQTLADEILFPEEFGCIFWDDEIEE